MDRTYTSLLKAYLEQPHAALLARARALGVRMAREGMTQREALGLHHDALGALPGYEASPALAALDALLDGFHEAGDAPTKAAVDMSYANDEQRALLRDLTERVKELSYFYHFLRLLRGRGALEETLAQVVGLLPRAMWDPAHSSVRLEVDGIVYLSAPFVETPHCLGVDIAMGARAIGRLEVFVGEAETGRPYFLAEEVQIIESTAELISETLERKHAEEALGTLARLPGECPCPVMRVSHEGVVMYANDASRPLLTAWNADVGQSVPPEWRLHVRAVVAGGETRLIECLLGDNFYELHLTPIPGEAYVNVYGLDHTEHRLAQLAYDEQYRLLQTVMETMPNPVFYKDVDGRYLGCNKAFEEYLGRPRYDIIGQSVFDLSPPELAETYHKMDQALFDHPGVQVYESRVQDRDGAMKDCVFTKATFTHANGKIAGMVGVIVDITQRKQSERENERLAAALRQTAEMIVITDIQGSIEYVNPAFERVTGYASEEVLGANPRILKSGRHDEAFYKAMWDTVLSGRVWSGQMVNRRKDGSLFTESITITPVRDSLEEIVNLVAVKRDITQDEILKAELWQARKLESIGQLAAGIAHEINTPTQYVGDNTRFLQECFAEIQGLLALHDDLLTAADADESFADQVARIRARREEADVEYLLEEVPRAIDQTLEGIERVSGIIRSMKEFSHPGGDEKMPVDLSRAITSTVTVARNEWKYVADLETDFDPDLPEVVCLPGEINQVILNLVVNAAQAIAAKLGENSTDKGRIRIVTRRVGDWAEVHVEDSGTGIPEAIRQRVFDPFFTTKEVGRGTGQGLSLVHKVVVERHGGSVGLESQPGEGTTFTLRLPLQEYDACLATDGIARQGVTS